MKVIACCKAVQEEQDIVVRADNTLDFSNAAWKISQYDLNAIEAGKVLVQETGGSLTGLCVGGGALNNTKLRKDMLSRGMDALCVAVGDTPLEDSYETAVAIKGAIEKLGEYDLVLCGTGSGDMYAQSVGTILGTLLGVSVMNDVAKIIPGEGVVQVERSMGSLIDTLEITLPAVLSVTADINEPAIPGMRDILKAGKKPVAEEGLKLGDVQGSTEILNELAPPKKGRENQKVEGDDDEALGALVSYIHKALA